MAGWQDAPIVGRESSGSWQDAPIVSSGEAPAPSNRNPDGTYGQPPEGAVMDETTGQMIDVQQRDKFDQRVLAAEPVAARANEFIQGAPLAGEWIDEGVENISPQAAERARMFSDAMERQHPVQSAALNVAGGITASVPLAAGAATAKIGDFIAKGGNTAMRGLRALGVAAPSGAVEGASSFAGRAEDGQRLEGAKTGAVVGGALGAVLGPLMSAGGEGITAIVKRIKKLDVRTIADEFQVSPQAARVIKSAIENDDLDAAQRQLARLGDDAMLADAGPATGALLDASASTGGAALKTATDAVGRRAAKSSGQLTRTLDGLLGKPKGVKTTAKKISQQTLRARQKAYGVAYSQPIDYAGPTGRKVEDALSRIPPKTLNAAIEEANEAMTAAGHRNQQIMAQIADDGSVTFREMPNVQQLDEIKKALDTIARESVDQYGRPTGQGVRATKLARGLRNAIKEAVPEYSRALRVAGGKIQEDEALDLGRKILFRNVTVEDVKQFMNEGVSHQARRGIQQGMRESIEQNLSNVRRTISDPNIDAREAMQLVKEMSSRANKEKLTLVMGSVRANRLLQELDRSAAALGLRAAISQNSKTAIRQSIQGQVAEEVAPGLVRRAAGNAGNPFDSAQDLTKALVGIDPASMGAREKALFDEIASALVNIKGTRAERALSVVNKAMQGQPIKDAQAKLIGSVLSGASATGLYQLGKQNQAR